MGVGEAEENISLAFSHPLHQGKVPSIRDGAEGTSIFFRPPMARDISLDVLMRICRR